MQLDIADFDTSTFFPLDHEKIVQSPQKNIHTLVNKCYENCVTLRVEYTLKVKHYKNGFDLGVDNII